ncbi:MAG: hypothetical protein Tsb0021_18300 [Chlamydiales bacterium]
MGRLSCVPFHAFHQQPNGSLVRSAFIVESIGTRFSSKSQKKFAILTISDGIESFELPIWPEMYEEKSFLLNENQLLYAILQIEHRDQEVKLQCKWLDNLSQANEEMIQDCDRAFDRAKSMAQRKQYVKRKEMQQQTKNHNSEPIQEDVFRLKIDADRCRLSHIVSMKKVFESYRGTSRLEIEFLSGTKGLATIYIDAVWGVAINERFKKEIFSIPSVLSEEIL